LPIPVKTHPKNKIPIFSLQMLHSFLDLDQLRAASNKPIFKRGTRNFFHFSKYLHFIPYIFIYINMHRLIRTLGTDSSIILLDKRKQIFAAFHSYSSSH